MYCFNLSKYCRLLIILKSLITTISFNSASGEDVTSEVFSSGQNENIYPAAYGDYNGDKFTDMVVILNGSTTFDMYFGSNFAPYLYLKSGFHRCHITFPNPTDPTNNLKLTITGIVLADFTGDSAADICVSYKVEGQPYARTTFVQIFKGSPNGDFDCQKSGTALTLNSSTTYLELKDEPLIVDMNGDTIADLFGETMDGQKHFWIFDRGGEGEQQQQPKQYQFHCDNCDSKINYGFTKPAANGFVDLNGDFSPELVLLLTGTAAEKQLADNFLVILSIAQVDSYNHIVNMKAEEMITLPSPAWRFGNPLAFDMSLSGNLHLLIPYCRNLKCKHSDFLLYEPNSGIRPLNTRLVDDEGRTYGFLTPEADGIYGRSINFYIGDYDRDGYPDLIGTLLQTQLSSSQAETRAVLFKNVHCNSAANCAFSRQFAPDFTFLAEYPETAGSFFFDLHEDGLLDVMMVGRGRRSNNEDLKSLRSRPEVVSVYKNVPKSDAYFVKWLVTTSVCESGTCPASNCVRAPGASMMYSTTDLNNHLQTSRATQNIRSHFALDFPYTVMGTGTSANFIDTVQFGITKTAVHTKTQIIPNSILIAIPPSAGSGTSRWEVKQLMNPSVRGAVNTFHALLAVSSVIGGFIFWLWLRERRQDKLYLEHQRNKPMSLAALTFA